MTKDVIVSINGMQSDFTSNDSIEVITTGSYIYKNNKHYIQYIDNTINESQETKTTIKIDDNKVDIIRFGGTNTHMEFEINKKHLTQYKTPFGDFLIGFKTKEIKVQEEENIFTLNLKYQVEINNNYIGDNDLYVKVQSKDASIDLLAGNMQQSYTNKEDLL